MTMPDLMDLLRIVGPLALIYFLGASILGSFGLRFKKDPLAYPGWAFGTGILCSGILLFGWLWFNPQTNSPLIPDLLVGGGIILGFVCAKLKKKPSLQLKAHSPQGAQPPKAIRIERLFFALVVLFVLSVVLFRIASASLEPLVANDEAGIWSQKAKVLWLSAGFNKSYPQLLNSFPTPQKDYPLLNPLLQVFEFANWGRITLVANRLPFQALSLASVFVLAASLRQRLRPSLAGLILLMVVSWRLFAWESFEGDGEVLVVFGSIMALDGWLRFRIDQETSALPILAVGLSILAWSKNEALMIAAALGIAALLLGLIHLLQKKPVSKPSKSSLVLLPPLLIFALGRAVNSHFGFESPWARDPRGTLLDFFLRQFPTYSPIVLNYFWDEIFFYGRHSGYIALALLAWILAFPRKILGDWTLSLPALALFGTWTAVMAVFIATPAEVHWHLITAAKRVAFQTMPACGLLLAAAAGTVSPCLRPWNPPPPPEEDQPQRVPLNLPF
jgi:hypothetical protein